MFPEIFVMHTPVMCIKMSENLDFVWSQLLNIIFIVSSCTTGTFDKLKAMVLNYQRKRSNARNSEIPLRNQPYLKESAHSCQNSHAFADAISKLIISSFTDFYLPLKH
jgi:hypothetical protein